MRFTCGSFRINRDCEFRDYSDLREYVTGSGVSGVLLGEDASDFMSFHAIEAVQPFVGEAFRIGIILDGSQEEPVLCPIHARETLAIGMNKSVEILDLSEKAVVARLDLESWLHHILCNDKVLVAVHELGALVVDLSTFQEIAIADCEVVADASLSDDELILVSMDEQTRHVNLAAARREHG